MREHKHVRRTEVKEVSEMKRKGEEEIHLDKALAGVRPIEMKEIKPRRKVSLKGRVLRLMGMNGGFEELSSDQKQMGHAGNSENNYYKYQREVETTLLEAERKKAEALMEWQKRLFTC